MCGIFVDIAHRTSYVANMRVLTSNFVDHYLNLSAGCSSVYASCKEATAYCRRFRQSSEMEWN